MSPFFFSCNDVEVFICLPHFQRCTMESVLVVKADAEALCLARDQPVSKSLVGMSAQ